MWVKTRWECCGNHRGDCVECPVLLAVPGNVEVQNATALECDECGARLSAEREEEVRRERELLEREAEVAEREEEVAEGEREVEERERAVREKEEELKMWEAELAAKARL